VAAAAAKICERYRVPNSLPQILLIETLIVVSIQTVGVITNKLLLLCGFPLDMPPTAILLRQFISFCDPKTAKRHDTRRRT